MACTPSALPTWMLRFDLAHHCEMNELPESSFIDSFIDPALGCFSADVDSDLDALLQHASPLVEARPLGLFDNLPDCLDVSRPLSPELAADATVTSAGFGDMFSLDLPALTTPVLSPSGSDSSNESAELEESAESASCLARHSSPREPRQARSASVLRSPSSRISKPIPHNEVERKYRDTINRQLDRLCNMIPSICDATATKGPGKPSKNFILTSAINYITELEAKCSRAQEERDLLCEIFRLSDARNTNARMSLAKK